MCWWNGRKMLRIVRIKGDRVRERERGRKNVKKIRPKRVCRKWRQRLRNTARWTLLIHSYTHTGARARICVAPSAPLQHSALPNTFVPLWLCVCVCARSSMATYSCLTCSTFNVRALECVHKSNEAHFSSASIYVHSTFAHFVFTARAFFFSFVSSLLFSISLLRLFSPHEISRSVWLIVGRRYLV